MGASLIDSVRPRLRQVRKGKLTIMLRNRSNFQFLRPISPMVWHSQADEGYGRSQY